MGTLEGYVDIYTGATFTTTVSGAGGTESHWYTDLNEY